MSSTTLTRTRDRARNRDRSRTRPARPEAPASRGSVVLSGIAAAAWVVALSWAVIVAFVTVAWATAGSTTSAAASTRLGSQVWLLVHHVALRLSNNEGAITIAPLGLTLGVVAVMYRGGIVAARAWGARTTADCWRTAAAFAAPYAVLSVVIAGASRTPGVRAEEWQAGVFPALLAFAAAWVAAIRHIGVAGSLAARLPIAVRLVARATLRLSIVWCVASAVLLGVATVFAAGRMQQVVSSLTPGSVGTAILAIGTVLLVPNGLGWAGSYAIGGGVTAGQAAVSPFHVTAGPLPSLPPLAALPQTAPVAWLQAVVAALPIIAIVVAWRLERAARRDDEPWWHPYARTAGLALAGSLVICASSAVSGGELGRLRLGPSPLRDAGLAFAALLVAGWFVATLRTWSRYDGHVASWLDALTARRDAVTAGVRARLTGN